MEYEIDERKLNVEELEFIVELVEKGVAKKIEVPIDRKMELLKKLGIEAQKAVLSLPNEKQYLDLYKKSFASISYRNKLESRHD